MRKLANFVVFQIGWLGCIMAAARGHPLAGTAIILIIAAAHLALADRPRIELRLLISAAFIGAIWDSVLAMTGWVRYPNGTLFVGTAPYWIVALWVLFATTLNVSLAWLKGRVALAALLGAIGGPLSFLAGARLGALAFGKPFAALTTLAIGWAILTPLLLKLAQRFDGISPLPNPEFLLDPHRA